MKYAIIIGATSGIGREVAKILLHEGWKLGIAGRREKELLDVQAIAPEQIAIQTIDITQEKAANSLLELIEKTGGMNLFFLASGIGFQNPDLLPEIELNIVTTNAEGFTRMTTAAFNYFAKQGGGHLAIISSIAGTKGLGVSPAYSATKRFQNTYLESLSQLSHIRRLNIRFTDIRPGFVATALLDNDHKYPMLMQPKRVAKLIVRALKRHKRVAIIDWRYAVLVAAWRLIPRWLWERLTIQN